MFLIRSLLPGSDIERRISPNIIEVHCLGIASETINNMTRGNDSQTLGVKVASTLDMVKVS